MRGRSQPSQEPWWSISGEELLAALRRVELGETADLVYLEMLANAVRPDSPPN